MRRRSWWSGRRSWWSGRRSWWSGRLGRLGRQGRLGWLWVGLAALVLAEIGYPLAGGAVRARLVVVTVLIGYAISVAHAALSRAAVALILVTTGGGFAVEAVGVATGYPFGSYSYSDALGPKALGVPLVIPLAWTWMAWPSWLVAGLLVGRSTLRVPVAGLALASWDLFLDPQMVASGYWTWRDPRPALPGVPGIPISNYLGWLVVATVLAAILRRWSIWSHPAPPEGTISTTVMVVLYLWTYASGVLAHAVFLGLPWSALWGGIGMGLVAVPLAAKLARSTQLPRSCGLRAGLRQQLPGNCDDHGAGP